MTNDAFITYYVAALPVECPLNIEWDDTINHYILSNDKTYLSILNWSGNLISSWDDINTDHYNEMTDAIKASIQKRIIKQFCIKYDVYLFNYIEGVS